MLTMYNTMTRKKEVFRPTERNRVKMFTCGPSIYQRPHLGNYRTFLYEDILERYLKYLGYQVERILNFTDVEDKAIEMAKKNGVTLQELTNLHADMFLEDAMLLNIRCPTYNPRSSTSVDQAVKLIQALLDKKYAYWYKGDIFYDPLKFEGFGKLYGLDMSRWPKKKRRFRKDTYPGIQWNRGDFILWHGCKGKNDVCWDTEIGKGRPAWNIQDAAMATKHLGFNIDVWCGGIDNLYRHHDYTIAIVEAVSRKEFVRYWMHGAHLLVNGKKMSKSKGNVAYVNNLIEKGLTPQQIRFFLICEHYRKSLNLTEKNLATASHRLSNLKQIVQYIIEDEKSDTEPCQSAEGLDHRIREGFEDGMNNDLDVGQAFRSVSKIVAELYSQKKKGSLSNETRKAAEESLRRIDGVLKVLF